MDFSDWMPSVARSGLTPGGHIQMSNNITHGSHYLPQRYQLGFSNQDMVWIYDRENDSYRNGHPKNVGVKNDFYTTADQNGQPSDKVEKMFTMLEGKVWPVIDRLDARNEQREREDRLNLALFVAFFRTRVPAFDKEQNNFTEDLFRWSSKASNPSPQAIVESLQKATGKTVSLEEAKELFRTIRDDEYEIENPRQNNIKMMLSLATEIAEALVGMQWTVFWSPQDRTFITSDNPFVLLPPPEFDHSLSGVGILTSGATSLIPLSKQTLLCLRNGDGSVIYREARRDFVRYVNCCVAANSDRFIIARDEALLRSLVGKIRANQWRNEFKVAFDAPDPYGSSRNR
jgi:hypothetical protein